MKRALKRFFRRLTSWTRTSRDEERLRAEIAEHVAMLMEDNLRAGMPPAEARRQAMLQFGGMESMKEEFRGQRTLPFLETLAQDTRYGLRRLRKAPVFTIATVLTLALGIGATTSIFTLVDAVLLKSLPVANPAELYRLGKETRCCYLAGYSQDGGFSLFSYDLYRYLRDHTSGFSELAAVPSTQVLFGVRRASGREAAESYPGEFVSGNYFAAFGIGAYAGRTFTDRDDRQGAPPVAVMSYRLWQQKYGSAPSVIGGAFQIDDHPFTVVGISPPGFFGDTLRGTPPDFFLPLNTEPYVETDSDLDKYNTHWLDLIGRIRPGVSPASVEAGLRVELRQWLRSHAQEMNAAERAAFPRQTVFLSAGGAGVTSMRDQYRRWLRILMTVAGFVLLIACANIANLMLVRGMERRRQIALSLALGARASRVVREPLTESVLLALMGGAAGLAVAFGATRLILHFAFPSSAGLAGVPIAAAPSMPVLWFTLAVALLTGIAFGIAPAWMATRVDPSEALRGEGRSTARRGLLPRKVLVVFQAALSLALLSTSGLLTAALSHLQNQDFGFQTEDRWVANINPRDAGYRTAQLHLLYQRLHDSLAGIPGVDSAALCLYSPMKGGGWGSGVFVDGKGAPAPGSQAFASWDRVTPGYFATLGTPILAGRDIDVRDDARAPKVAVINEAFARKFFPHQDPIGKRFGGQPDDSREFAVVGVAKDARHVTINPGQPVLPGFFLPEAQADYSRTNLGALFLQDAVIRTRPGAGVTMAQVRRAVAVVDPDLPVSAVRPLREQVAGQFIQQRLIARLTSMFGILALVLAAVGLYGVTAYNTGRRFGEIGLRMALGAGRGEVVALVMRGAAGLILAGLVIGVPLSVLGGRFLGAQLFGTSPYNLVVMLVSIAVLAVSAFAAAVIPALRASRISPVEALRAE